MKKLFCLTAALAMVGIALVILGPGLALALPNPPALLNTTWGGKYEIAYSTGFNTTGTMTVVITATSGALFRGYSVMSPPLDDGSTQRPLTGIVVDGELRMSVARSVICGKLIFDNTVTPAVWKIRGYWQNNYEGDPPYHPHTGYFLLKKQ